MNRHRYFLRVRNGVMALLFLALAWANAVSVYSQTVSTNWLSLNELIKKWEPFSFNEVGRAATNGDLSAQHYLGYCFAEGFRAAKDPSAAVAWYENALRGGYLPSANNLGLVYQRGLLGSNDMSKALYYYRYAADRHLPSSQYNLGVLYHDGLGVAQDPVESMHWFKLAADGGYARAMTQLYLSLWDGRGVPADHPKAMEWLTKAAEANDPYAQCLLGFRCQNPEWKTNSDGGLEYKPNRREALHWYRLSAEQGWAGGQYHLGLLYLGSSVVELDEERGLELVRAAADKGVDDAMQELAHLYARGVGEPRDEHDRPVELLIRSRQWQELMTRYAHGFGTEQDWIAVASCYCKWAISGSNPHYSPRELLDKIEIQARSHRVAGRLYPNGDGTFSFHRTVIDGVPDEDLSLILSLYLKSARGDGESARQLGDFYLNGQNAPKSAGKAWAWFNLAAENGSAEARQKAASLAAQMAGKVLEAAREYQHGLKEDLKNIAFVVAR